MTMSLKMCDLSFDNYEGGTFHAGETIKGKVIVNLENSQKIQELILKLSGRGKCYWSQGGDNSTAYQGKETYFKTDIVLIEKNNNEKFNAGLLHFPFMFILPRNAPSSFVSDNGKIKYKAKIVLKRPWKLDCTNEFVFNVLASVDLNTVRNSQLPVRCNFSKKFNIFMVNKGSLNVTFEIPASGYVSGQKIPIKYCLQNDSNVYISAVKIRLIKTIVYHSSIPSKNKLEQIVKVEKLLGPGIGKQDDESFLTHIKIPKLQPTSYTCSVIVTSYELKISIIVSGMHTNSEFNIPIVIGTVPFKHL